MLDCGVRLVDGLYCVGRLHLNRQVVVLMSGLGVPDQAFFTLQDDMLRRLADMLVREHAAVDTVAQVNYHNTTRRAILTYAPKLTHTHTPV